MSDAAAVGLCVAVGIAAFFAIDVPIVLVVAAAAVLLAWRKALVLGLFCVLFVSNASSDAWAALDRPLIREVSGVATLTRYPQYMFGSQRAEASLDGRRYQLWATGDAAQSLRPLLAGQRLYVAGTTAELTGLGAPSQRRKHVAGRLNADEIQFVDSGSLLNRSANRVREVLTHGLSYLPHDTRTLALGMTIGDDREQSEASKQMFRDANLAHLTAVSGANVAFVFVMFAPLLLCLSLKGRLFGGCLLLMIFGVMTRFEPSVLRAEAMAAMFLLSSFLGRPISLLRALAMGAILSLLIDPMLVGSIGFLLSISACLGMATLAPLMTKVLPGPQLASKALGFALGAQIGVAPIQVAVFGSVPVVGILANVLAGPFAGLVMISATLGALAVNIFGSWVAPVALGPTQVFADLIILIARTAVSLQWGHWTVDRLLVVMAVAGLLLAVFNTSTFKQRVAAARLLNQGRRSVAGQPSS